MIYLDYSATTPVNKEVLDSFIKINNEFIGNANSLHSLGTNINKLVSSASAQIASILNVKETEIIYTSGSTEANNLAIKGVCLEYQNRGKHIITSNFEHSSVTNTLNYLKTLGFTVDYVKNDEYGRVDLEDLKRLITDETILVTITGVNSELGIIEPIYDIASIVKEHPLCFFHTDLTQWIGKMDIDLTNIDLASFSAHKIYGLKGIGALIKKEKIELTPLLHGGASTTIYRSGTPAHPLIASLSKSLRLETTNLAEKYQYVQKLNKILQDNLIKYEKVHINSNIYSIPHILNISIKGVKSETFMHALEEFEVFVSTRTACSSKDDYSLSIYNLTKDMDLAKSSIRISISYLTTEEEINKFLEYFDICYKKLVF